MKKDRIKNSIKQHLREMNADVVPGYNRMGMFDRPGPNINTRKTVIPELPIAAMPHVATQLSVEAPNIDDPDFVPSKHDLGLYMTALSQRVPDEEAERFYRMVRKHVEKRYGRENDEKIGKVEESATMNSKKFERILLEVSRRFALNNSNKKRRRRFMFEQFGSGVVQEKIANFIAELQNEEVFNEEIIQAFYEYLLDKKYYSRDFEYFEDYIAVYDENTAELIEEITPAKAMKHFEDIETSNRAKAQATKQIKQPKQSTVETSPEGQLLPDKITVVAGYSDALLDNRKVETTEDIWDAELKKEKDPINVSILREMMKANNKTLVRFKESIMQFLNLSTTVQRAGRDGKGQEIKEDPNYFIQYELYHDFGNARSYNEALDELEDSYSTGRTNKFAYVRVESGYDPNIFIELRTDNVGILTYPKNWVITSVGFKGGEKVPPPRSEEDIKKTINRFKTENVLASSTNKLSKAKVHQHQRETGQLLGNLNPASLEMVGKERAALFPEKVSGSGDLTSGTKRDIDFWMLNQFLPLALKRKSEGGLGLKPMGMRDADALDKIIAALDKNYTMTLGGEPESVFSDELADIIDKHYNERVNLAKDAVLVQTQELLEQIWKREVDATFTGSPSKAITDLYSTRQTNIMGHILRNTLIRRYPHPQFTSVFPPMEISVDKFVEKRANDLNVESGEALIGKLEKLANNVADQLIKQLKEIEFSEPTPAEAAKWIEKFLKFPQVQQELQSAGIELKPKPKSKGRVKESVSFKADSFNHFNKFMDRILTESRSNHRIVQHEEDLNAKMRLRAAREKEHYLHSMRLK